MQIKKNSPWKFVQLARRIKTKKPAQKFVLTTLAQYANLAGYCYPSYQNLMDDTGYTSKHTISEALKYLRDDLKILNWKKGHSNQFKNEANGYTLDDEAMGAVIRAQKGKSC